MALQAVAVMVLHRNRTPQLMVTGEVKASTTTTTPMLLDPLVITVRHLLLVVRTDYHVAHRDDRIREIQQARFLILSGNTVQA